MTKFTQKYSVDFPIEADSGDDKGIIVCISPMSSTEFAKVKKQDKQMSPKLVAKIAAMFKAKGIDKDAIEKIAPEDHEKFFTELDFTDDETAELLQLSKNETIPLENLDAFCASYITSWKNLQDTDGNAVEVNDENKKQLLLILSIDTKKLIASAILSVTETGVLPKN